MGLIYSGVVIIPAVAVYFITVSASPLVTIGSLLFIILISLFDLTLSCALGWVVAKISQKLKNRSFITVLVSLLFFAAYYIFYFKIQDIINDLVSNAAVYGDAIKEKAYPIYLFGRVSCGDVVAMLIVSAFVLALFAIMWLVISHSFIKIATSSSLIAKRKYRESLTKENLEVFINNLAFNLTEAKRNSFINSLNNSVNNKKIDKNYLYNIFLKEYEEISKKIESIEREERSVDSELYYDENCSYSYYDDSNES